MKTIKPLTHKEIEALPLRKNTFRPTVKEWNEIYNALFSLFGMKVVVRKDDDFGEDTEIDGDAIRIDLFREETIVSTLFCNRETFPDTPNKSIANPHQVPKYRIDGYRLYYWVGVCGTRETPPDSDDVTIANAQDASKIVGETLNFYVGQTATEWQYRSKVLTQREAAMEKEIEDYINR